MSKDEALKLSLEALEELKCALYEEIYVNGLMDTLDKPIAVIKAVLSAHKRPSRSDMTWVGLTPQERDEINEQVYGVVPHHVAFHAAIEAKLKEKNTRNGGCL